MIPVGTYYISSGGLFLQAARSASRPISTKANGAPLVWIRLGSEVQLWSIGTSSDGQTSINPVGFIDAVGPPEHAVVASDKMYLSLTVEGEASVQVEPYSWATSDDGLFWNNGYLGKLVITTTDNGQPKPTVQTVISSRDWDGKPPQHYCYPRDHNIEYCMNFYWKLQKVDTNSIGIMEKTWAAQMGLLVLLISSMLILLLRPQQKVA